MRCSSILLTRPRLSVGNVFKASYNITVDVTLHVVDKYMCSKEYMRSVQASNQTSQRD